MEEALKFKTKFGYCHVLEDKLVMVRKKEFKEIDIIKNKNRVVMSQFIYGTLFIAYLYAMYNQIMKGEYPSLFTIAMFLILLFVFWRTFTRSNFAVIYRDSISNIEYKAPVKGVTRGYFKVFFTDEYNKDRIQLIILPGTLSGGSNEGLKAERFMKKSGYL